MSSYEPVDFAASFARIERLAVGGPTTDEPGRHTERLAIWTIARQCQFLPYSVDEWQKARADQQPATPAQEATDPALLDIHHAGSTYRAHEEQR